MKKLIAMISVIVFLICAVSCSKLDSDTQNGDPSETELVTEEVKNDSGVVTGKKYSTADGELVKEEFFDENGKVASVEKYNDGKVASSETVTRDSDGNAVSSVVKYYDDSSNINKEESYIWDGEQKSLSKTTVTTHNDDGSYEKSVTDKDGKNVSVSDYDPDGNLVSAKNYNDNGSDKTYYKDGKEQKSEVYDANDALIAKTDYEYDKSGEKIEKSVTYDKDGTMTMYSELYYDENGKLEKVEMYYADGTLYNVGHYDENGNVTFEN